jgi:hypothetical protein
LVCPERVLADDPDCCSLTAPRNSIGAGLVFNWFADFQLVSGSQLPHRSRCRFDRTRIAGLRKAKPMPVIRKRQFAAIYQQKSKSPEMRNPLNAILTADFSRS